MIENGEFITWSLTPGDAQAVTTLALAGAGLLFLSTKKEEKTIQVTQPDGSVKDEIKTVRQFSAPRLAISSSATPLTTALAGCATEAQANELGVSADQYEALNIGRDVEDQALVMSDKELDKIAEMLTAIDNAQQEAEVAAIAPMETAPEQAVQKTIGSRK